MDIANNIGMTSNTSRLAGFTVTLAGLTDNTTFGPCAERGVPLQAQTSGWEGATPVDLSYQWYASGDPIAGAVGDSFIPDAPLVPGTAIFCEVSAPGKGSRRSAPSVFRDIAPQLGTPLFNEIFDLDTGMQTLAAAGAFTGLNLTFSVTGAGAVIDPDTGELSVPTDIEVDGAQIIVTAANTGGDASAAFQITVENVALSGAIPFGGLTPAGAGGMPVEGTAIVQGDPGGHWEITGGLLVPTAAGQGALAGVYPLAFDNGDTLDLLIEDDKASARVEELEAVFVGLPTTARGLMVQDGDARPLGRLRLAPKVFDAEMVLEPTNWMEDTDPRASLRRVVTPGTVPAGVVLGGLTIGGDPSGSAATRMVNLTVQGFEVQREQGSGETEGMGVVTVEAPSRHVTIRQNEIWSRTLADIVAADDFRNNIHTSRQMRGIQSKLFSGGNDHMRIEENHIHDVSRGASLKFTSSYQGQRSRFCRNVIEHCYTNFFTCGGIDGLDIFDNRCMGVYAASGDTLGAIPATSPHSAAGGSFDASASSPRSTGNITMMGNLLHVGWARTKLHEDLGLPKPGIGATGIKFNDPTFEDSYYNIVAAFNTVVSHGICFELSGVAADDHIEVFNNTLATESYTDGGSAPVFIFNGAQNLRLWNNVGAAFGIGSSDGVGIHGVTLDTFEGYGNLIVTQQSYYVVDTLPSFPLITLDEALIGYVPKPGTQSLIVEQPKGALGTGLYSGDGVHSVAYAPPRPVTGTAGTFDTTVWDGSTNYIGISPSTRLGTAETEITVALQAEFARDGTTENIWSTQYGGFSLWRNSSNRLQGSGRDASGNTRLAFTSDFDVRVADGKVALLISVNMTTGAIHLLKNGVPNRWPGNQSISIGRSINLDETTFAFARSTNATGKFHGKVDFLALTNESINLDNQANVEAIFTADGRFQDLGLDGSGLTGTQPRYFFYGDAAGFSSKGSVYGGSVQGTLSDGSG